MFDKLMQLSIQNGSLQLPETNYLQMAPDNLYVNKTRYAYWLIVSVRVSIFYIVK